MKTVFLITILLSSAAMADSFQANDLAAWERLNEKAKAAWYQLNSKAKDE